MYIPLILSPTRVGKRVKGKTKGRAMTLRESRNRDALPGVVPLPERSGVGFAIKNKECRNGYICSGTKTYLRESVS